MKLMLILLLLLTGCNYNKANTLSNQRDSNYQNQLVETAHNKRLYTTNYSHSENQVNYIASPSIKDEIKIIPEKDYVFAYDVLQESTGVCEDWLNCEKGPYVYPFININGLQASEINQMTYRRVSRMIDRDEYEADDIKATYEYKTYMNDNILSVIIKWQSFYSKPVGGMMNVNDDRIFVTYNYDLKTNKTLSNLDLLAKFGFTVETYEKSILNQLKNMDIEIVYTRKAPENKSFVYYSTEKYQWYDPYGVQLNEDDSCIYIDENGKLSVIIKISSGPSIVDGETYIKINV